MEISLSRMHFPVTTLGPGNRIGIWMQGCSLRCKGCLSPDTWSVKNNGITVEVLVEQMKDWLPFADGITISGGEPFEQPEALHSLLVAIRKISQGDILVYSGYEWHKIESQVSAMKGLIDALISEPFQVKATQTKILRGSDNQQLHMLTALGLKRFEQYERTMTTKDKILDLSVDETGRIFLTGIPQRDDMQRLRLLLEQQEQPLKQLKK